MKRMVASVFISRVVASLAQAAMLILLARWLGPSEFGVASSFIGIGTVMVVLFDLGIGGYLLREHSVSPGSTKVVESVRISNYGVPVVIVVLFSIYIVAFSHTSLLLPGAAAVVAWIALERLSETWLALVIAGRNEKRIALVIVLRRVLPLAVQIPIQAFTPVNPLISFGLSLALGSAAAILLCRHWVHSTISWRCRAGFMDVVRDARHFWFALLSSQTRELEPAVVAAVAGATQGGFYSLAFRMGKPARLFAAAVTQSIVPTLAIDVQRNLRGPLRRIMLTGLTMTACAGLAWPAVPMMVDLTAGPEYVGAVDAVRFAIIGMAVGALTSPVGGMLQAVGRERFVGYNGLIFAVLTMASVIAGAAFGGATVATIAGCIVYVAKFGSLFWSAWRYTERAQSSDPAYADQQHEGRRGLSNEGAK